MPLLPGSGEKAFIDIDSTHKRVYGRAKQGAEYGRFKGIRTLHPPPGHHLHPPSSRPVIATVRMRRGKAADSRGAPKFAAEALATAVEAGCTGLRILRADSQFYNAGVIATCRRNGAHFSITCGMNPSIKRAIAAVPDTAWQQITYPTAVPDPDTGELISGAEVAEIPAYTAFASRKKAERVTARLIVRRVRDLAKPATVGEQGELFPVWRYHPFFTDNPAPTLQAEQEHRHHAVVESAYFAVKKSMLGRRVLRARTMAGIAQEVYALLCAYQLIRIAIADATGTVPGADPDRASFTIALQTARDQVIQAANVIADTVIDLVGTIGQAVLDQPMPARRTRVSPRAVKRPLSRYAYKSLRVDRRTYKATISIDILSTAARSP
jgi:Transposase DDE domain group 1